MEFDWFLLGSGVKLRPFQCTDLTTNLHYRTKNLKLTKLCGESSLWRKNLLWNKVVTCERKLLEKFEKTPVESSVEFFCLILCKNREQINNWQREWRWKRLCHELRRNFWLKIQCCVQRKMRVNRKSSTCTKGTKKKSYAESLYNR